MVGLYSQAETKSTKRIPTKAQAGFTEKKERKRLSDREPTGKVIEIRPTLGCGGSWKSG